MAGFRPSTVGEGHLVKQTKAKVENDLQAERHYNSFGQENDGANIGEPLPSILKPTVFHVNLTSVFFRLSPALPDSMLARCTRFFQRPTEIITQPKSKTTSAFPKEQVVSSWLTQ